MARKCEALINLDAIRSNYGYASELAQDSKNIAVIKADAYGHGAIPVARALRGIAPAFAVAILEEALELRAAGISEPLLVMEGVDDIDALEAAVAQDVAVVVHDDSQLRQLERSQLVKPASVWLKVDTGMHRLGLPPSEVPKAVARINASDNCDNSVVVCTHLACADDPDSQMTAQQIAIFDSCTDGLNVMTSISNSAGILAFRDSHRNWNRPGYMLFGNSPFKSDVVSARDLVPAMTLQSEIIAIREVSATESVGYGGRWTARSAATIATVAVGYADGYPRTAADGTPTLVNGQLAPLAGVVSMDMITVDVTEIDDVKIGDAVVLWGDDLSVNQVAREAGTIGYELLSGLAGRVPRRYPKS